MFRSINYDRICVFSDFNMQGVNCTTFTAENQLLQEPCDLIMDLNLVQVNTYPSGSCNEHVFWGFFLHQ